MIRAEIDAGIIMVTVHNSSLKPHEKLLYDFCCITSIEDDFPDIEMQFDENKMDWGAFINQSVRHGIAPQIAKRLKNCISDKRIPTHVFECFDKILAANRFRNKVIYNHISALMYAFNVEEIPNIVLKGAALALDVYPDYGDRNFADVDILVDRKHFIKAGELAVKCGFEQEDGNPHPEQIHVVYLKRCGTNILTDILALEHYPEFTPEMITPQADFIKVEIHQNLFRRTNRFFMSNVDLAPFWESTENAALPDGTPIQIPCAEAMAVHLCDHAATHNFGRLIYPLDLKELIHKKGARLNWYKAQEIAQKTGKVYELRSMLLLLSREFNVDIPPLLRDSLEQDSHQDTLHAQLTVEQIFQTNLLDEREQIWKRMTEVKSKRAFVRAFCGMLFPPVHFMEVAYGVQSPAKIAILYCWRPFRLAAGFGWVLSRRFNKMRFKYLVKRDSSV